MRLRSRSLDSIVLPVLTWFFVVTQCNLCSAIALQSNGNQPDSPRERIRLHTGWKFWRSESRPDNLVYEPRPYANDSGLFVLKPWILPTANEFIENAEDRHDVPTEDPDINIPYVKDSFDDSDWEGVKVPHDWAIKGPFYINGDESPITGQMGSLPLHGVGWYRRKLSFSPADVGKSIYLEIDGAMSYSAVWVNGKIVGGWPYGYNSYHLDITSHLKEGDNQLAIRIDNPPDSGRWYTGAGIYRNVWLTKVKSVHVARWGTYVTSEVTGDSASIKFVVNLENNAEKQTNVTVQTEIFEMDSANGSPAQQVAGFPSSSVVLPAHGQESISTSTTLQNPRLWGPPPSQSPNLYLAVTTVIHCGKVVDTYETQFGIRSLTFGGDGFSINGERLRFQGVNQHHDLGALGAAYNHKAAERQLHLLREAGVNAIRMAHNPPAPELLELTDRLGFMVIDEIFDVWNYDKNIADFSLIFADWHEPDVKTFVRRDRNHASIIMWSIGNEVGEQGGSSGFDIATELSRILHEEDNTRPIMASLNSATASHKFPEALDVLGLNYIGEGMEYPGYSVLPEPRRQPLYESFHEAFPDKLLFGSEFAWSLSSRSSFIFPVTQYDGAPVLDHSGGDVNTLEISGHELYSSNWSVSHDIVFTVQDQLPYLAGGFLWSGWDYLGEPYPWPQARSAYSGMIDLAGFKKERFWLYQSRWNPTVRMAHILPHWSWPGREGEITPVHVFTSADEAELFVNGKSQGKLEQKEFEYRFRWDNVTYEPGELHVITYKDGEVWANETVSTTSDGVKLSLTAEFGKIDADGEDLTWIAVSVLDGQGRMVPEADDTVAFSLSGPGEIVATDNGFQADFVEFPSKERKLFNGLALAIVRANSPGKIVVAAEAKGLERAEVVIEAL
ncbi:unnamed protein product [Clonostachys solani]|uniref:Beta-galactosidase n=1 Tax=Clonostachys solani TaxID=160281 RepID=A0A9N9ZG96_9HYPO|nr:unnamed protein product [Clonostachys solani]